MTTNLEKSLQIDAPVQEVYRKLADLSAQWHIELLEQVPNESMSWRMLADGVNGTSTVRFEPVADGLGTSVVYTSHYPQGVGQQTSVAQIGREMEASLQHLADLFLDPGAAQKPPASQLTGGRATAASAAGQQPETEEATQLGEELQGSLEEATGAIMGSFLKAFDSPLYRFGQMMWDMEQQFSGFIWGNLGKNLGFESLAAAGGWTPAFDLARQGDRFVVSGDLPGYTADHLHVEIRDGRLHISGERPLVGDVVSLFGQDIKDTEEREVHFHVTLGLSEPVNSSQVEAQLNKHGRLEITLPIKTAKPARSETVAASSPQREVSEAH